MSLNPFQQIAHLNFSFFEFNIRFTQIESIARIYYYEKKYSKQSEWILCCEYSTRQETKKIKFIFIRNLVTKILYTLEISLSHGHNTSQNYFQFNFIFEQQYEEILCISYHLPFFVMK